MSGRIGIASLIWGFSFLLARVIGVVREAVIGRVLGGGAEADAYWAAFVLPDYLNYLLASGALTIVFIPIFSRYLAADDEAGGWRVFSHVANFTLALMTVATAVVWVFTPELVAVVAPGFDDEQLALLTRLTRIMLPAQAFHLLGALLSSVLQAKDKHTLPAFANLGYTACIIGFGVALGPTLGAEGFAWGVLVGSVLGPFGLPLVGCLRDGLGWRLGFDPRDPDLRRYLALMFPVMVLWSIVVLDDWFLKRFGSLAGEGVISRLQYAKTLMRVPMGVFGMATGFAAYPTLARMVAEGRLGDAYATLVRACRMMLVLAFAAQAAFTVAGAEVATVIWGTRRFTTAELDEIGLFTGVFCLALGAWAAQGLLARGFYAQQRTWLPSLLGTGVAVAAYPVYAFAAQTGGGLALALTSSGAIVVYTTLLALLLRRSAAGPDAPDIASLVLRMVPAVALGVGGGVLLDRAVHLPALVQGALTGSVALGLTLGAARLFGVPEVAQVTRLVVDKVGRRLGRRR